MILKVAGIKSNENHWNHQGMPSKNGASDQGMLLKSMLQGNL